MTSLKRQLSENEKEQVLAQHGRRCFVDGAPILDEEPVEYHHIKPWSLEGPTQIENIAPVCRKHHLTIGTMSLEEYRDKLQLEKFFADGTPKYLDAVIRFKVGRLAGPIRYEVRNDQVTLFYRDSGHQYTLYACPTTKWKYFYATLPIEYLHNDTDLQPRPLRPAFVWELYRHFRRNTQLAPSICRIGDGGEVLLFDGQHKAAAQIWANHTTVECKVYLRPDPSALKETNLEAHGQFRQMSFYSDELMKKYAGIFGEDWNEYMTTEGAKSEKGFFDFLVHVEGRTKAKARKEITLALRDAIIRDPDNRLSGFISSKERGGQLPLTHARLDKAFFQQLLTDPPIDDEFESDTDYRREEHKNIVRLMNIVVEEGLKERWNPERADSAHKKAERIFSAGAVRAWMVLLRNVINVHLKHYTEEQRQRPLYCPISAEDFEMIQRFVRRIFSHKLWNEPDPSGEIAARLAKDDIKTVSKLFEEKGVTVEWVLMPP